MKWIILTKSNQHDYAVFVARKMILIHSEQFLWQEKMILIHSDGNL